jgi:Flp pilus assembly protein CpaB
MFRSRSGALLAGIAAALLAAILLIVYLRSYRSSVNSGKEPVTVLVAKRVIPSGTPAITVAKLNLYQITTVPKDHLADLAISDPGALSGQVTAHDILPGAQLTTADFTTIDTTQLRNQIIGRQRAISVPVDTTHGLIGQLVAGDKVDVYVAVGSAPATLREPAVVAGGPLVKLLASNILVLVAPGGAGGAGSSGDSSAVLRVTSQLAAKFAFAAQNAVLYLVLRPANGAAKTAPSFATLPSLLVGNR